MAFGSDRDNGIESASGTGGAMMSAEIFLCPAADYDPVSYSCDVDDLDALVTVQDGVVTNRADVLSTINPSTGEVFVDVDDPGLYDGAIAFIGEAEVSGERREGVVAGIDPTAGLTFTVTDGQSTNQSAAVGPGDCELTGGGTLKCLYKDPSIKKKKVKATFKPTGNAGEYSFKLGMNKLSIPSPQGGPATLSIAETGGATFVGSNANCQVFNKKMVCKD